MMLTISILFSVSKIAFAQANRYECDESCGSSNSVEIEYSVVCPVGFSTIKSIDMAPRLKTLNGKTIAIVGDDFMYNITHPELKRLIEANYPSAKVILYDELPIAGPYPAPGIKRQGTEEFRRRLAELKVDAVIAGNGGCGICTPKETGSCIVAEKWAFRRSSSQLPDLTSRHAIRLATTVCRYLGWRCIRVLLHRIPRNS